MVKQPGVPLQFDWRWELLKALIIPWFRLAGWRIRIEGLEHVPQQGGAVIAFNHHSYADAVMLAWGVVHKGKRPLRYLAKREACEGRWIGWVTRWISVIPVDRGSPGARAKALAGAEVAVTDGDLVAIAPEQTISDSLDLLPFRHGPARVALATGRRSCRASGGARSASSVLTGGSPGCCGCPSPSASVSRSCPFPARTHRR